MKNKLILIAALLTVCTSGFASKIQKQGVKGLSECISGGATAATCLIDTSQLYDVTNSSQLSAAIAAGSIGGIKAFGQSAIPGLAVLQAGSGISLGQSGSTITITNAVANLTSWALTPGYTFTGAGSVSNATVWQRQVGDSIELKGKFTVGTVDGTNGSMVFPGGTAINSAKMDSDTNVQVVGYWNYLPTSASENINTEYASGQSPLFYDGSSTGALFFTRAAASAQYVKQSGTILWSGGAGGVVSFHVWATPIN